MPDHPRILFREQLDTYYQNIRTCRCFLEMTTTLLEEVQNNIRYVLEFVLLSVNNCLGDLGHL